MDWLVALHVLGAVFVIGPMAILPMTGLRAIRAGNASEVHGLSRTVAVMAWLSAVFAALGIAAYYALGTEFRERLGLAWLIWSVAFTLIGIVLTLAIVVPHMNAATRAMTADGGTADNPHYRIIAIVSGLTSLLFLAVAVLMVVR
jgi:uncharacterized membrane protein